MGKPDSQLGQSPEELKMEELKIVEDAIESSISDKGRKRGKSSSRSAHETFFERLGMSWRRLRSRTWEVIYGLRSSDKATRRMSGLFLASLFGLILVIGVVADRYFFSKLNLGGGPVNEQAANLGEFFRKQASEAKQKSSMISLGTFIVQLKTPAHIKLAPRVFNLAEVEIVLECDGKDTRQHVESNLPRIRDQLTDILSVVDRDEFMSRDGKNRLKKAMIDRLNSFLHQGRVENLYFAKLIIS